MTEERIVYVHEDGSPTGETAPKLDAHHSKTRLHLAFSCYVFNESGKFLVTQRAHGKKVWPNVWTNSVCGHPLPNESIKDAITRRLDFELGMQATDIQILLPNYTYKTPPYNGIIEHEFCPVFAARATSQPKPNPEEVDNFEWLAWQDFVTRAEKDSSNVWSWWCKDQLKQLKSNASLKKFLHRP